ncbi:MAG TPA: response regulator [Spirochaetia bacterium]|nr:response regulator [Spirochaetaceae bacterium]HPE89597.1 response regulator [Spirochaetales bacterium]HRW23833.1 response regulator [Spirochaetia bacterium]
MKDFKSILIVDDSSTSRMIVQRCLEMTGLAECRYSYAEDGLSALSALRKDPGAYDLIVTDLNMPKMDGVTFVRLVKNDPASAWISVIVVSSIADGGLESELTGHGAAAVIKKPVSPAKLAAAIGGIA